MSDAVMLAPVEPSFDYVDLNEIDPTFNKLYPAGVYTLKVMKAEEKKFTYKNPPARAGQEGTMVTFQLAITGHDTLSGRRLFPDAFFASEFTFKIFRKLQDVTGVIQVPGTPLSAWLQELSQVQPEFKTKVALEDDIDYKTKAARALDAEGKAVKKNTVNWFELLPA